VKQDLSPSITRGSRVQSGPALSMTCVKVLDLKCRIGSDVTPIAQVWQVRRGAVPFPRRERGLEGKEDGGKVNEFCKFRRR